jgi:hypothetical protein
MERTSRYLAAGSPTECAAESCLKPLHGTCVRGKDNRYYCSEVCAQVGLQSELARSADIDAETSGSDRRKARKRAA